MITEIEVRKLRDSMVPHVADLSAAAVDNSLDNDQIKALAAGVQIIHVLNKVLEEEDNTWQDQVNEYLHPTDRVREPNEIPLPGNSR